MPFVAAFRDFRCTALHTRPPRSLQCAGRWVCPAIGAPRPPPLRRSSPAARSWPASSPSHCPDAGQSPRSTPRCSLRPIHAGALRAIRRLGRVASGHRRGAHSESVATVLRDLAKLRPPTILRLAAPSAEQHRTPAVIPADPFRRLDRGIWILRCCLITEAKRDHWSTHAGRNWKPDRRRNLRLVRRASPGSVSPFDITTSKQLLRCGAAHGACCAVSRVCLGGGLSCWPPLCLSRSSPDVVTPPSRNLMGRPRRDVRSRSRACPCRFPPPVVA